MDQSKYVGARSNVKKKKPAKKGLIWAVTVFFALAALVYLTSGGVLTGLIAAALVALIIPIDSWQTKIKTVIKGKLKTIIAVVLAVLCFATAPAAEPAEIESSIPSTAVTEDVEKIELKEEPAVELEEEPAVELEEEPVVELEEEPVAQPEEEPVTQPEEDSVTESEEEPVIEPDKVVTEPEEAPVTKPEKEPAMQPDPPPIEDNGQDYVVNTNTGKFHYPSCSSAGDIKVVNRWDYYGTRDELVSMGYKSCGKCHP